MNQWKSFHFKQRKIETKRSNAKSSDLKEQYTTTRTLRWHQTTCRECSPGARIRVPVGSDEHRGRRESPHGGRHGCGCHAAADPTDRSQQPHGRQTEHVCSGQHCRRQRTTQERPYQGGSGVWRSLRVQRITWWPRSQDPMRVLVSELNNKSLYPFESLGQSYYI